MNDVLNKIGRLIRDPGVQIDITGFTFALLVSALVGIIVSALYQIFYENRATGSQIHRSFLLLAPSITALFIAIQFSLPLSLGLLGALSIIRFRTPIKEPEEVGFLMLLIASAVVCATFQFLLLFVLLSLALAILVGQKYIPKLLASKRKDGMVLITINNTISSEMNDRIFNLLEKRLPNGKVESVSYGDSLTTIHYSFAGLKRDSLGHLSTALKDIAPIHKMNFFFNNQSSLL